MMDWMQMVIILFLCGRKLCRLVYMYHLECKDTKLPTFFSNV